ncbi:MAG: DUF1080 domain-containing protein [Pirellula sp.]
MTMRFFLAMLLFMHCAVTCESLNAQEPVNPSIAKSTNAGQLEPGFEWLFNGVSTDAWEGNMEWFRVEDKCIVAGSLAKAIPHNEFLCTKKQYGDFELKLQVRLKGQGDNAGVQFRTVRIPNNTEVSGFQCDVGNAFGRPVWGALYDESRRRKMLAEGDKEKVPQWLKKDDWNELTVRAEKDRIQIWLNGNLTVDYTEADPAIAKTGIIGLQIHSGPPTEAWYRNIRIKVL